MSIWGCFFYQYYSCYLPFLYWHLFSYWAFVDVSLNLNKVWHHCLLSSSFMFSCIVFVSYCHYTLHFILVKYGFLSSHTRAISKINVIKTFLYITLNTCKSVRCKTIRHLVMLWVYFEYVPQNSCDESFLPTLPVWRLWGL